MPQVNGQKESCNPVHARLIQDKFSRFKAQDVEAYKERLKKMTLWDLSEEAVEAGFSPGADRHRIEQKLLEDFKKAKNAYDVAQGKYQKPGTATKEPSDKVKEIFDFMRH